MDVTPIIDPLNDAQRDAVTAEPGHALILAGAGSGKTRVLVHRIAWLLATGQAMPYGVLAVTFTNKAAAEMRGRIESMLGHSVGGMWVGTFHGLAHRMLRAHWRDAGLAEGFQIIDSEDQLRLIRRIMREMELDDGRWPPKQAQWFINARKEEGLRAAHIDDVDDMWVRTMVPVYKAYEDACETGGLVDFAELLLRSHELLREREDLAQHYRERFRFILVDEFQDTNAIQYAWIQLLAGEQAWVFTVGDDDQSIYSWRGARIENIQQFPKDFPGVVTHRLEQNYRSTGNILAVANKLIANNFGRLGKNLWTEDSGGDPIYIYSAYNDVDEARYVVARVESWVAGGGRRDETAILYRVSAQSRVFEESLLSAGMPYRVHGGFRFYERAEIKDALGYLRLTRNIHDDAAFERVVNTPTRGIGTKTLDTVRARAREGGLSLWGASQALIVESALGSRAANALGGFQSLVAKLSDIDPELYLEERVAQVVEGSGLIEHFKKDKGERGEARIENLEELVTAARQFQNRIDAESEEAKDPLLAFLSHTALEAGEQQADEHQDSVGEKREQRVLSLF
ncbi:MAG: UvrD-helicase domain-containing protein [Pseudomonadota bacterium]